MAPAGLTGVSLPAIKDRIPCSWIVDLRLVCGFPSRCPGGGGGALVANDCVASSGALGQHLHMEFFLQSGANCRISIIDMNNHAEIGNSVTHLAAPRKTYAPPRRPGTGKTYSETGRHAWGERTRPPKFIGKNRTYPDIDKYPEIRSN